MYFRFGIVDITSQNRLKFQFISHKVKLGAIFTERGAARGKEGEGEGGGGRGGGGGGRGEGGGGGRSRTSRSQARTVEIHKARPIIR